MSILTKGIKHKHSWVGILSGLAFGGLIYVLSSMILIHTQAMLLSLIAAMVIYWSNEAIPFGVTSLLPIILFPAFDIAEVNQIVPNYSKSIIFLFLGGFMLAIAVEKTGLHKVIATKMLRIFPETPRGMIFALSITSGVLSSCLSNTTTTLLLMPLAFFLTTDVTLKIRFALAIAYGASVGGITTPIGTPPNLILYGVLEDKGIETLPFIQWVLMVAPLALLMFFVVSFVLSFGLESKKLDSVKALDALSFDQKKLMYTLGALVLLLFANSPLEPYYPGLNLNEKAILLSFGLLMFVPPFNLLVWEDTKKIPFEIMFLFGAGFSIAYSFSHTGLSQVLAEQLSSITTLPPLLLLLIIALLVTFTTEITSNTALISMLLPVLYEVSERNGLDTRLFLMVATICSSYAFMLPIATPPNAIAMSSGVVNVQTMAKFGFFFNLAGIFLIIVFAYSYWSVWLT
ncbi:MAG: SLC13/DASS family transporter [SAR324 cluster bacterium]|nr:SLC13/DASS family transporter [SAR324 cluster bacterium]MBL7034988.1 SLC13/DASS family transporter [SAR324 cluster bacterium]